ncbi:MAG: hypothetical protein PHY47_00800 [Lachnospiraceae bacterium]|nr:hypothetical protein [Lachnospiraceae bacterium]
MDFLILESGAGEIVKIGPNEDRNKIYYGFINNYSSQSTRRAYIRELRNFLKFLSLKCHGLSEFEVEQ